MTWELLLPKPTRFVDISKAGNTMAMTSDNSVYSVPIGSFRRLVMTLSFMVMEADGSSS